MGFFSTCSLLYELSNEYLSALNGLVILEEFGFEATMVITRVCDDVIKVFVNLGRMFWPGIKLINQL